MLRILCDCVATGKIAVRAHVASRCDACLRPGHSIFLASQDLPDRRVNLWRGLPQLIVTPYCFVRVCCTLPLSHLCVHPSNVMSSNSFTYESFAVFPQVSCLRDSCWQQQCRPRARQRCQKPPELMPTGSTLLILAQMTSSITMWSASLMHMCDNELTAMEYSILRDRSHACSCVFMLHC